MPVASIALILGVDRFMSEARALTNLIGNGVATIVVAKWEGALDEERMRAHLNRETGQEADSPETVLVAEELDRGAAHPRRGPAARTAGLMRRQLSKVEPASPSWPAGSMRRGRNGAGNAQAARHPFELSEAGSGRKRASRRRMRRPMAPRVRPWLGCRPSRSRHYCSCSAADRSCALC